MTPSDFLHTVWPDEGYYCIAIKTDRGYWHTSYETIEQAAAFVDKYKHERDVFFCVHALREEKVWDNAKTNPRDGSKGAWAYRKQTNMLAARCFFFDLDIGDGQGKYPSLSEAVSALRAFVDETGLPEPMLVKSGGGLHVYWLLEDAILSDQWRVYAARMRALANACDLIVDPARTTDTASVLRVVGTFNLKRETPRPVRLIVDGDITPNDTFIKLLTAACEDRHVTAEVAKAATGGGELGPRPDYARHTVEGNTEKIHQLVKPKAMLKCRQFEYMAGTGGDLERSPWRAGLSLFKCVKNGKELARDWSSTCPERFDDASFEANFDSLNGAHKCATIEGLCGAERCMGCPWRGKGLSPYSYAQHYDAAPPPNVVFKIDDQTITYEIPAPPHPYKRTEDGTIVLLGGKRKNSDGDDEQVDDEVIYDNDLYPLCRIVNSEHGVEQYRWRVVLKTGETSDFNLDVDALYDKRKFTYALPHRGVIMSLNMVGKVQSYMIAYIKQLQRQTAAEAQHNHLGWSTDHEQFILPDKILCRDGRVLPVHLSKGVERTAARVARLGTLEKQVELLNFYCDKAYLPNQFVILASLAAPIFYMTGHHGAIINASGEAGASKSTTLYTAASLWGVPDRYPLNGTRNGATINARNNYLHILSNLPVCVDEITHIPAKDAADMAMNVTQPDHKRRLDKNGVEQASPDNAKATLMLTTANSSLHGLLSVDNTAGTAGSMRVIEIIFKATKVHAKFEADLYWAGLQQNYGHIGPAFLHYIIQHQEEVHARVLETMRHIDAFCNIKGSERFWSATCAAVLVAGEIANQLGLIRFNMLQLKNWITTTLLPYERNVITAQYATPINVLTEFLEQINENILITKPINGEGYDDVLKEVRGQLLARYDTGVKTMFVLKKAFRDYCIRIGANHLNVLHELNEPHPDDKGRPQRIVTVIDTKKVLGARTRLSKGQSPCFAINMAHPEVSGVFSHEVVETREPTLSPSRADLTVITNPTPVAEPAPEPASKTGPAERKIRRAFTKFDLLS